MFHLEAGIDLQEPEVVAVQKEFHRTGGRIADLACHGYRGLPHLLPQVVAQRGRRRFFDDLLVAALNGTLALEQMHQIAVAVAEDLDFHMPSRGNPAFQEQRVVAKRRTGFATSASHRFFQPFRAFDHAHAAAPTARRRLDQNRIADLCGCGLDVLPRFEFNRPQRRNASFPDDTFGGKLVAHRGDGFGTRPDPANPRLRDSVGEGRVFRQKPVAGMHGIRPGTLACGQYLGRIEVCLGGTPPVERDSGIRLGHERRIDITIGVHGNRANTHVVGGTDNATRNLAPVGDEQAADGLNHICWHGMA